MNTKAETSDRKTLIVIDEAGEYFCDNLKEILRKVDGVPNATYLVKDGRVFVFENLLRLFREALLETPDSDVRVVVKSLISQAWVSPLDAVINGNVIPYPYLLERLEGDDRCVIRHDPFNATIPCVFESQEIARQVLAELLVGNTYGSGGSFIYKGQSLALCDPITTDFLPPRPDIEPLGQLSPGQFFYTNLVGCDFLEGFDPLTYPLFEQVKQLESSWMAAMGNLLRAAEFRLSNGFSVMNLPLSQLNDPLLKVSESMKADCNQLRTVYPELSAISDGALFNWFESFMSQRRFVRTSLPERNESFLFYLFGKVVDLNLDDLKAEEIGMIVADAIIRGESLDLALDLGRLCSRYSEAIGKLAFRISKAICFLREESESETRSKGRPIMPFSDFYGQFRKSSFQLNTVNQVCLIIRLNYVKIYNTPDCFNNDGGKSKKTFKYYDINTAMIIKANEALVIRLPDH